MRRPVAALALMAWSLTCVLPAFAADDKTVQNMKGSVSYQKASATPKPIAPNASVALADKDYTITGNESLAAVTLPDSSQVMVGASSKVQLAFFNQTDIAHAKFVIFDGHVRFAVRHPNGAHASYTFQTPTGSVGVRGTQGDIAYDSDGSLRVNVYEVCDPNAPVQVTTKDGKTFTVVAGQSLLAQVVNGVVQAQVNQLTQELINQFSPDFGVPNSWDEAKGQVIGRAQDQATDTINSVTGGIGGSLVGGLFGKHKSTPSPSPQPSSASCS